MGNILDRFLGKNEFNTYNGKCICSNCETWDEVGVEKGTSIEKGLKGIECDNCGMKTLRRRNKA